MDLSLLIKWIKYIHFFTTIIWRIRTWLKIYKKEKASKGWNNRDGGDIRKELIVTNHNVHAWIERIVHQERVARFEYGLESFA